MLVLQKAVKMVWDLPEVMGVAYAFMLIMLCWMILWSFGVSGVVALSLDDGGRWWLLVVSWQVFTLLSTNVRMMLFLTAFTNHPASDVHIFSL